MTRPGRKVGARLFALAAVLLTVVGCSARYKATKALAEAGLVQPTPAPQPLVVDPAMATVVFVRPGTWSGMAVYFDERSEFLGATMMKSKIVIKVVPGQHTIYAATFPHVEATRFLRGSFEAGKIYFVEQAVKPSIAGGNEMFVISPRNAKTWPQLRKWVADSPTVVADAAAGNAFLQKWHKVIDRCRELADDEEPDDDEAALVTIMPQDGFVEPPYWDVAPGATPPPGAVAATPAPASAAPTPAPGGHAAPVPAAGAPPAPGQAVPPPGQAAPPAGGGCTSDTECRGNRICHEGRCQSPGPRACGRDVDCPDPQICANSVCAHPGR